MTYTLPPEFAGFEPYSQFILWRLALNPTGGKPLKQPVHPDTGRLCNAHDPANQRTFRDACAAAARLQCGVGFAFSEHDNLFFVDVDNALLADGTWSETAQAVYASFPGACFEISYSGTGFHLFGRYDQEPVHACKRTDLNIEFYTRERFVALTLKQVLGGWPDLNANLHSFAASWFPVDPDEVTAGTIEWVDQAVPEWRGPADDAELIQKMLASQPSLAVMRGEKASVQELWAGADSLGKYWPDGDKGREFDHSSADVALCMKLAFWTGKNPARIERIFRQSGLFREYWDEREYYRNRTVSNAIKFCDKVLGAGAAHGEVGVAPTPAPSLQLLTPDQQAEYFKGCIYVVNEHKVLTPNGLLLKDSQFKAKFGGYEFSLNHDNSKTTMNAFECITLSQAVHRESADILTFRPEDPPGQIYAEEGLTLVNSYVPIATPREVGDVSPMLRLLETLLPDEYTRLILTSYCAAQLQYPGVKFQWAPVIQGAPGNGKTLIISAMAMAVGRRYSHYPDADDLASKFNLWLQGNLIFLVEELYQAKSFEVSEKLKAMITNSVIGVQGKGKDQITGDNRGNFMFLTNHKDACVKDANDRRLAPMFTAQQTAEDIIRDGMGGTYFPRMWKWLLQGKGGAYFNQYLHSFAIPDELNPATECHRAPITSSTAESIALSAPLAQKIISEAIAEQRAGFKGGWISSIRVRALFKREQEGSDKRCSQKERNDALVALGFIPHPRLSGGSGRASTCMPSEDNARPIIYCLSGSVQQGLQQAASIQTAYVKAQQTETAAAVAAVEVVR